MKKLILPLYISIFLFLTSCSFNEGGVRTGSNMEAYALDYLEQYNILDSNENILAYYDYTLSLDGTTAAILTENRLIYHNKDTATKYFYVDEITEIDHYEKTIEGLFIRAWKGNELMVIEIAMLNNGNVFLDILKKRTGL